ncbi:MAG: amidohydrolase family protein, partial [Candidatus Omnitrophota bacterium]
SPMKRFPGGMRIVDGKIRQIYNRDSMPQLPMADLGGMHIIPGLIDAHRHFFVSALLPLYGNAGAWRSKVDALAAIEAACRPGGTDKPWVMFSGLNNALWKNPALPSLTEIDAVAASTPVLVIDSTCHRGLVSSAALYRAGINRQALKFPTDVDLTFVGRLKGTIWEDALGRMIFAMYREVIQNYSAQEQRKLILDEAERCLKKGLTHVHDPGVPSDVQRLLKDAQPYTPLKISWSVTGYESLFAPPTHKDDLEALNSEHAPKSVKFFLDGATRTAASIPVIAGLKAALRAAKDSVLQGNAAPLRQLFEQKIILKNWELTLPYQRYPDTEELINRAGVFADKGYRTVMHALGNVAACQAAHAVRTLGIGGKSSIEHAMVMHFKGLDDLAGCGAVVSLQPGFIPLYAETIERMGVISPYLKVIPLRSLMDRGVSVCISSDGPCASDDPLQNIRRAVDRKRMDGTMFDPGEAISEIEALTAGTIGGSRSLGLKNDGLVEGAAATFCVIDGNPFSDNSRVVQTWIDGKRAY